jgi:hypothetical protein
MYHLGGSASREKMMKHVSSDNTGDATDAEYISEKYEKGDLSNQREGSGWVSNFRRGSAGKY